MPTNYEQNLIDSLERLKDAEQAVTVAKANIAFYMGMVIQERSAKVEDDDA